MNWDQPHWSDRTRSSEPPRRKLRPNGFAKLARYASRHAMAVVVLAAVLAGLTGGFAISRLQMDTKRQSIAIDEPTSKLQAALDRAFPGIEQTFLAVVADSDPDTGRRQALALASALSQRTDVFLSAFVPGTDKFYDANALLYEDTAEVRARVDGLLQMEPLYHALAAAPDMLGFAALVRQIGTAVQQGRSPPGLTGMLQAVSASVEAQVKGTPRPLRWTEFAGLASPVLAKRWYVIASPVPGQEQQAAAAARQAAQGMQEVLWLWPERAQESPANPLRDFVIPAWISMLLTMAMLSAGLGSFRQAIVVVLSAAMVLGISGTAAALLGRPVDGVTSSVAFAVLAPLMVIGVVTAVAYGEGRARGLAAEQAVMLAAQRQGGLAAVAVLLFAAVWVAWLVHGVPSLGHFAVIALIGLAAAWLAALLVMPAALRLTAARRAESPPHWPDGAVRNLEHGAARTAWDLLAVAVLALAVFATILLPSMRFGERQPPLSPPLLLETPDARRAVHILAPAGNVPELVARLSELPEVGAIRTATQFLPPNTAPKVAELRRLAAFTPFEVARRSPADDVTLGESFADLQQQLATIAEAPASSGELREAATRLRRAFALFASAQPLNYQSAASLEVSLFGSLVEISQTAQRLAVLGPPTVAGLDPQLLRRFVSPDGIWRIEVLPRNGLGETSFAAALHRAVPQAAGEPIVTLVRNEAMPRRTYLAAATALIAAAMLVLAAMRSIRCLIVVLAPAAAFVPLAGAATVFLGISLSAAMLAGISSAIAVLMACSMLLARRFAAVGALVKSAVLPLRAALLAPATLAFVAAPFMISSRPAVAGLGAALALLMLIAALLVVILVPAMTRWLDSPAKPEAEPQPE